MGLVGLDLFSCHQAPVPMVEPTRRTTDGLARNPSINATGLRSDSIARARPDAVDTMLRIASSFTMSAIFYLYDPADNLALGQAIQLANGDSGQSLVVPFANKTGAVNGADPASAGLGVIETAIAGGPLVVGQSNDPLSNQLSPAAFQALVSVEQWQAIKAMVKASVEQSPPEGWSEASLEAPDTRYAVISSDAYPQLKTDVFTDGAWQDADTSDTYRGNPRIAFGGKITDEMFVDFAGHFMATPGLIGASTISRSGKVNSGTLYNPSEGDLKVGTDQGSIKDGLTVDAGAKAVHLVNFSATSMGFGTGKGATDALGFTSGDPHALGLALRVTSGDVQISGDFVLDQLVQVVDGTESRPGAVSIEGSGSKVSFDKARLFLGAMRGYESSLRVDGGGLLKIDDSRIYAFSSSNSDAPVIPGNGLDWADFINPVPRGSAGPIHMIEAAGGGTVQLNNSVFSLEDRRDPTGAYSALANNMGINGKWENNDYRNIASGDLHVATGGHLEINGSTVLGSITADPLSASLTLKDSVVAGTPLGSQAGGSLVQLAGGATSISNSLIDSLDALLIGGGSLSASADTHILSTSTPWTVSTTTDPLYAALPSLAGASATSILDVWGDKESGPAARIHFQFQGPSSAAQKPAARQRTLPAAIGLNGVPVVQPSGAQLFSLSAAFQEAVSGLERRDLEAALGDAALTAGWSVASNPISRDGGKSWSFQLQSPVRFRADQTLQLQSGATDSVFVKDLRSSASNAISLSPLNAGSGADNGGGSGSGGDNGGGSGQTAIQRATLRADRLFGTADLDTFLFDGILTGTNPKTKKIDLITDYQRGDEIRINGFADWDLGAAVETPEIFRPIGVAKNTSVHAIRQLLGNDFQPGDAAVFQVVGQSGSFLAVNYQDAGYQKYDMLVHLVNFVPTLEAPLYLS